MRYFTAVRIPSGRTPTGHRGAASFALAAAIACGIAMPDAVPCLAGTVVRGRLHLPTMAQGRSVDGKRVREALDARDAVIYVTAAPGSDQKKLGGRAGRKDIEIEGDRFSPRVLPVVVNSKVRFLNRDRLYHNVFSVSPSGRFNLGNLAPGKKRETRFERPGVINLFCELHPLAAGFVLVCPNWYFTRASASGHYFLPELPRGSYIVHAWHPRRGSTRRLVQVTGRDPIILDMKL